MDVVSRMIYNPQNETAETKAEKIEKMEEKATLLLQEVERITQTLDAVQSHLKNYVRPMLLDIEETQHMDFSQERHSDTIAPNICDERPQYWDYWENGIAYDAEEKRRRWHKAIDSTSRSTPTQTDENNEST